jgi:glycosyltransferase involved in cell wall biosynthesis
MNDLMTQTDEQPIRRRRILMVPSDYPDLADPLQFNGSWTEEQVRALSAHHDVAVVNPLLTNNGHVGISECEFRGVRTVTVRYRHVRKTLTTPYVAATWRGLRYVRPQLQPECIHAHGLYPAGFAAVLLGRVLRVPVVVTEQWGQLKARTAHSRVIRSIMRFTLRHVQAIAISKFLANEMYDLEPRSSVSIVPNMIAPDFLEVEPQRARKAGGECELLFVGSIRDNRKGLEESLRALRIYLDSPGALPCRLTVIGDGQKREWFEELATTLGLRERCRFLGNQTRGEVARAMMDCDLFIMPSKYETFGVVYVEAMACGKPVIACAGGPAEEIVPPWAGALAPPRDHVALASSLRQVISELDNYDERRIADYARRNYGPEAIATAISRVYEHAIESRERNAPSLIEPVSS